MWHILMIMASKQEIDGRKESGMSKINPRSRVSGSEFGPVQPDSNCVTSSSWTHQHCIRLYPCWKDRCGMKQLGKTGKGQHVSLWKFKWKVNIWQLRACYLAVSTTWRWQFIRMILSNQIRLHHSVKGLNGFLARFPQVLMWETWRISRQQSVSYQVENITAGIRCVQRSSWWWYAECFLGEGDTVMDRILACFLWVFPFYFNLTQPIGFCLGVWRWNQTEIHRRTHPLSQYLCDGRPHFCQWCLWCFSRPKWWFNFYLAGHYGPHTVRTWTWKLPTLETHCTKSNISISYALN